MEPRYQCLSTDGQWWWRLLGSNHRELARGTSRFADFAAAAADARQISLAAPAAAIDLMIEQDTTWRWRLSIEGSIRAVSAVGYARRLECSRAIERFRACAGSADVSPVPLTARGRRTGTAPSEGGRSR